jgi:hypothetical protein
MLPSATLSSLEVDNTAYGAVIHVVKRAFVENGNNEKCTF